jgi:protein-S-isoprenylcysteine O-methyltransferase Ste14
VFYLWLSRPRPLTILVGSLVVIAGIGVRAVASGQLKKNEELATAGPYSYTRNPLYLGSILIAIGFAIAARSLWIWVLLLLLFVLIYVPVIGGEEAFLRSKFPDFDSYAKSVPRLIPQWSGQSLTASFSRELYLKHREYNAVIGAVLMMLAIGIKMLEVKGS